MIFWGEGWRVPTKANPKMGRIAQCKSQLRMRNKGRGGAIAGFAFMFVLLVRLLKATNENLLSRTDWTFSRL